MKIQVINAKSGNWYRNYIDTVFDVEMNASGTGYRLIDTPHNESILKGEPDGQRRQELLKRLTNKGTSYRLGIMGENATLISGNNNNDFKGLLSQEW